MVAAPLLAIALQAAIAPPIVVTGEAARIAHANCLKQRCSPDDDANATIAFAEQRMMAGDYQGARKALLHALRRQKQAARSHPQAVSALYTAHATVSLHYGAESDYRRSGLSAIAVIRDAFPPSDARSIAAIAYAGDVHLQTGRHLAADRAYRSAIETAREAKLEMLADALEVRRASFQAGRGSREAQRLLVRYAEDGRVDRRIRNQAALFAARAARTSRDEALAQRMLALLDQPGGEAAPTLAFAPPIDFGSRAEAAAEARKWGESLDVSTDSGLRWADIGFWVRADGRVVDAEVIRGPHAESWAGPILQSIRSRRYLPIDAEPGDPGRFRVERYTLAAEIGAGTGSRIVGRIGPDKLRMLDVTEADRSATAAAPGR